MDQQQQLPRGLLEMRNLIPYLEPTDPESALWPDPWVIHMQNNTRETQLFWLFNFPLYSVS